jgi:hypothetical protein
MSKLTSEGAVDSFILIPVILFVLFVGLIYYEEKYKYLTKNKSQLQISNLVSLALGIDSTIETENPKMKSNSIQIDYVNSAQLLLVLFKLYQNVYLLYSKISP